MLTQIENTPDGYIVGMEGREMICSSKTYRSASADVVVERYEGLYYGWLWRVLYRYDWQNKYTIYENGLRERPSEDRIAQICKNIG